MEWSRCFGVLLLLLGGLMFECQGCWEHEKVALLQLKPFFPYVDGWNNEIENCCDWEMVECNSTSGRVTKLFLNLTATITMNDYYYSGEVAEGYDDYSDEVENGDRDEWYLDASLFLSFEELNSLYLSGNSIAGCFHNQGFERLTTKLDKLEILDLSSNYFNESILFSLSELSSLKSLNLGNNPFIGSNAINGGAILPNAINGFKQMSKLKNLELLACNGIMLGNNILSHLHDFTSLKFLYLQSCGLKGTIEMIEFSNMLNLKELYLGENEIESLSFNEEKGEVGFPKLEVLELTSNLLDNSILESLGALSSLKRLYIGHNNLKGSINIKVLKAMSNLKELYMQGNEVSAFIPSQVNGTKLELANLEVLDLTENPFNKSILPFLKTLTNLNSLSLGGQEWIGTIDLRELRDLNKLQELHINCYYDYLDCSLSLQSLDLLPSLKTLWLFGFNFNGTTTFQKLLHNFTNLEELELIESFLPTNFLQAIGQFTSLKRLTLELCEFNNGNLTGQGLLHLKNLESLVIYYTSLENSILDSIGAMHSLNSISLTGCGLNGTLPVPGICELTHLRRLDISYNNLMGYLPDCFSNLTSLEYLDLSSNQLSGNISYLQNLTSLRILRLSDNHFHIPSSLGPLFNLSKLKRFVADNNAIYAETEMTSLAPRFQLNEVSLSCCGEGESFPRFLYYQHDLYHVDLSNINLTGGFPNWLLENNTGLASLNLANNSLGGNFKLPLPSRTVLSSLDISKNSFNGNISVEIGEKLPNLRYLNMSKNSFTGDIPASMGDMKFLERLDLSNNILTGGIPEPIALGCSNLQYLVLSNNSLQDQMFSSNFSLKNLLQLQLDGNNFSGRIPDCLSLCSQLGTLDVSNNQLSGMIPGWMGYMSSLENIIMANNHLNGTIPMEFCQLYQLGLLDLSGNSITGNLPSCFSPSQIKQVHLSKNKLRGVLTNALRNSFNLETLDISDNKLSGGIPSWIGELWSLSYLLLNKNSFEGKIPSALCKLRFLSLINLSHNNLSGHIPPCLKLTTLNVSQDYFVPASAPDAANAPDVAPAPAELFAVIPNSFSKEETIEFPTKNLSLSYKGRILNYMSGLDLSCNNLVGEIPYEIGNFHEILVLNLSHNSLTGPIPPTLSNLKKIESLDLSHNNLSGNIPPQLVELNFLSYFNVSWNNLSGNIPRTAQFATFQETSYLGNAFLCGEPLPKCVNDVPNKPNKNGEDNGPIDMDAFCVTFGVAYVMVLLSIGVVLYINPYWRRVWFYRVETIATSCYYFVIDNILPRKFHCRM